jgi:phosphoribosylformylglycinamidine synthase subunit PurS
MPRVHIDVMLKDEILDPQGQAVERSLPSLGFSGVSDVRIGKHIELEVADDVDVAATVEALSDRLLANPVIERFTWRLVDAAGVTSESPVSLGPGAVAAASLGHDRTGD